MTVTFYFPLYFASAVLQTNLIIFPSLLAFIVILNRKPMACVSKHFNIQVFCDFWLNNKISENR